MTTLNGLVARREQDLPRLARRLGSDAGLVGQRVDAVRGRHVRVGGRCLINFTSSDYLGLAGHPETRWAAARGAARWGVSLSQPRFWATDRLTAMLERELARLTGREQALVFSSTTALAHDVLPILAGPRGVILIDECAYPISGRAAQAAAMTGGKVRRFRHNDPADLARVVGRLRGPGDRVIVCDGVYMPTGQTAALEDFHILAERYGAIIYLDDAQGLGLLGAGPSAMMPYGHGGAGTPAYCGVRPGRLAHVSTLAKAFGVPLAFIAGPAGFIDYLRSVAFSHIHSSPPALPVVAAALAALHRHANRGEQLRRRLLQLVRLYQSELTSDTFNQTFPWPMQSIYFGSPEHTLSVGKQLRREGIWPIVQLRPEDNPAGGAIRFLITASHTVNDLKVLVEIVKKRLPKTGG